MDGGEGERGGGGGGGGGSPAITVTTKTAVRKAKMFCVSGLLVCCGAGSLLTVLCTRHFMLIDCSNAFSPGHSNAVCHQSNMGGIFMTRMLLCQGWHRNWAICPRKSHTMLQEIVSLPAGQVVTPGNAMVDSCGNETDLSMALVCLSVKHPGCHPRAYDSNAMIRQPNLACSTVKCAVEPELVLRPAIQSKQLLTRYYRHIIEDP